MFEWIHSLLGSKETAGQAPARSGSVTGPEATKFIEAALRREHKDAEEKLANPDYWRDVGAHVSRAAVKCETVLLPIPEGGPDQAYYDRVLPALDAVVQEFRDDDRDEDGYGVATVHQINRDLQELAGKTD